MGGNIAFTIAVLPFLIAKVERSNTARNVPPSWCVITKLSALDLMEYIARSLEKDLELFNKSSTSKHNNKNDVSVGAKNAMSWMIIPPENNSAMEMPVAGEIHSGKANIELQDCFRRPWKHKIRGSEGNITISFIPTFDPKDFAANFCELELLVPPSKIACVQTKYNGVNCTSIWAKTILRDGDNNVIFDGSPESLPERFCTYSNILKLRVEFSNLEYPSPQLLLSFSTVPDHARPRLKTVYLSATTGYIQITDGGLYFKELLKTDTVLFVNSWAYLVVPADHIVAISFDMSGKPCRATEQNDYVAVHTQINSTYFWLCNVSSKDILFYSGNVSVKYRGARTKDRTESFKILFSFHRASSLPLRLSDGRWNCSDMHWPDMQQRFPCNFHFECVGGEDEARCWENTGACSQGQFEVDGRCFLLTRADDSVVSWNYEKFLLWSSKEFVLWKENFVSWNESFVSWDDESLWCRQRGGQLASLSTRKLWDTLIGLFRNNKDISWLYVGARLSPFSALPMYRTSTMWSDGTVAHFLKTSRDHSDTSSNGRALMGFYHALNINMNTDEDFLELCFYFDNSDVDDISMFYCRSETLISHHLCEFPGTSSPYLNIAPPEIRKSQSTSRLTQSAFIRCPGDHFTHVFLACDGVSSCWNNKDGGTSSCSAPLTSLPELFRCAEVQQSVPYTLVCDHRADCVDGSDEGFCSFPACAPDSPFQCSGRRCVKQSERCNGQEDCNFGEDENRCSQDYVYLERDNLLESPVKVDLGSNGSFLYFRDNTSTFLCDEMYFVCVSFEYVVCLPVYLRCNKVNDCPGHEDEAACDSYSCPGFYRCRDSQVCVHESHMCDGVYQCPQRDDEILCNETCPENCICHGWAFVCTGNFPAMNYFNLRYLDASGSLMNLADVEHNTFLVYLALVGCNLTEIHEVSLPNLRALVLTNNQLTHINSSHLANLTNLEFLKISNNPLTNIFFPSSMNSHPLKMLDLSEVPIFEIDFEIFGAFSNLNTLNLSGSHIETVTGRGFHLMQDLRTLDLRQCPITQFPRGIFRSLDRLETVYTENYKLCCPALLPSAFNVINCHAPADDVSSCDDLLRSNIYRVGLAVFATLALLGNLSSLFYRLIFHKTASHLGYDVFVTNLCVADFLMGLYLLIIGITDLRYRSIYLWEDVGWRNSVLCTLAGFTCLLSSEVSVLVILCITFDRFVVLRFPFSQMHLGKRSAQWVCAAVWVAGITLAAVPLMPMASHWKFYSQTSICLPLPTSRVYFPGRLYSFGVIVILNFVIFLLIFFGQISIYWSVRANSISAASTSKTFKDINLARRLISVAMSDFFCWFPIGVTGILAACDIPISGEVNVGIAIFVMPFNSMLNPFLYSFKVCAERMRCKIEKERRNRIVEQIKFAKEHVGTGHWKANMTVDDAVALAKGLLSAKILSREELKSIFRERIEEQ